MDTAGWSGVRDWRVTLRALGSRSVLLPPSRERLVGAVVVAAVGLSLATWICSVFVGDKAPLAIPALTYLMAVLLVSVVGRLVVGFVAALVAAALMAYYFAPPYHTFAIDDGTIIGSTIAFLLVAGFASLLITGESWSRQTADDARRRLGLIAEASGELTETLDERRALQVLAELATKTMADYCVVDVLENGELRRTVVAGGAAGSELIQRMELLGASRKSPVYAVVETGHPVLMGDPESVRRAAAAISPAHAETTAGAGVRSSMIVPLSSPEGVLGAMSLVVTDGDRRFVKDDLDVAVEFGRRAGAALFNARLYRNAESERARLTTLLERLPVGVMIAEPDGTISIRNDVANRLWPQAATAGPRSADGAGPLHRALDGEIIDREEIRVEHIDRQVTWLSASAAPIRDSAGEVLAAVVTLYDLTEHREATARLEFLSEASRLLSSSLAYEETLQRLAELVVPRLADWCSITVSDEGGLRNVAVAHRDPEKVKFARDLQEKLPPDPNAAQGAPHVIRTGQSEFIPIISEQLIADAVPDEELRELLYELKLRSAITAPLSARGRTFGAISLVQAESNRRYTQADLLLAEDLGARSGLAIDNARLYSEQAAIARTLQRSLLPARLPDVAGVEVATRYNAAGQGNEVGGDFYDLWRIDDERFGFCIGDVCGKGAPAAAVTALTRHTIRTASLVAPRPDPEVVLVAANDGILRRLEESRFCTVVYGYGTRRPGGLVELVLASAGHPPPLVVRDGQVLRPTKPGTLLGVFPEIVVSPHIETLRPGDRLVLWTDGISERRNDDGAMYGEQRLVELIGRNAGASAETIAAVVEKDVLGFSRLPLNDDLAMLVLAVG
jgi:serine phosphatase RsbU (regulator of sigma subunit)/PAS domain-containing protein